MIERSLERFDLYPSRLLGGSGYGSAETITATIVLCSQPAGEDRARTK
jgi:hypothetical protein